MGERASLWTRTVVALQPGVCDDAVLASRRLRSVQSLRFNVMRDWEDQIPESVELAQMLLVMQPLIDFRISLFKKSLYKAFRRRDFPLKDLSVLGKWGDSSKFRRIYRCPVQPCGFSLNFFHRKAVFNYHLMDAIHMKQFQQQFGNQLWL